MIAWSNKTTRVETDQHDLFIRTGESQRVKNILAVLYITSPRDVQKINDRWAEEAGRHIQLSMAANTNMLEPEMVMFDFTVKGRLIEFALVWGIVLNGSRKGKLLQGNFYCALVEAEEINATLKQVFKVAAPALHSIGQAERIHIR